MGLSETAFLPCYRERMSSSTRKPPAAAVDARAKSATTEQLAEAERLAQATQASQKLKTHARRPDGRFTRARAK